MVSPGRAATIASMAPCRSPVRLTRRSDRNALSRWVCGSTAAVSSTWPVRSMPAPPSVVPGGLTDSIVEPRNVTSAREPSASVAPRNTVPCSSPIDRNLPIGTLRLIGDAPGGPPPMHPFELGAFFFGGVELDDPGAGPPAPMDRRISNDQAWKATTDYVSSAVEAERLGYDSFWTTEHHFQHEGYEVIPNGIQLSTWIAAQTSRLRLGTMFNVVPQWNPLRLAEDFTTLHNLSGGRGILGVGRGTVPREVLHLNDKGVSIGSHDNPDQAADDDRNRRVFEESMEVLKLALDQESFSYRGEFF